MSRAKPATVSKYDQLRALREAKARHTQAAVTLAPVTKKAAAVTNNPRVTEKAAARKLGRPRKPGALSPADRQRAYRQRQKASQ